MNKATRAVIEKIVNALETLGDEVERQLQSADSYIEMFEEGLK